MNVNRFIAYISEAEELVQEDANLELAIEQVIDEYATLPTTHSKLFFPADQVPIIVYEDRQEADCSYGVGIDIFGLFMEKNGITDIKEAYSIICKKNNIEEGQLALIFDSDDALKKAVQECRCCGDCKEKHKKLANLSKTGGLLKVLKNDIPIAKEPAVQDIQWNDNSNIVNIERNDNYMSSFDAESFKAY